MTLVLNTEEVVRALDLKGYIEAMEEAFTELGKGAAINAPRTETGIPLRKYGTSREVSRKAKKLLRDLPLDADPHQSPFWVRAAKRAEELNYRLKTIPGGYPKCGIMALKIDSTTDTNPVMQGVCTSQARHSACDYLTEQTVIPPAHAQVNSPTHNLNRD